MTDALSDVSSIGILDVMIVNNKISDNTQPCNRNTFKCKFINIENNLLSIKRIELPEYFKRQPTLP